MIARLEKSTPPMTQPSAGITTASTNADTILPNAAPITMPTAMSSTLPFIANSLNSETRLMVFSGTKKGCVPFVDPRYKKKPGMSPAFFRVRRADASGGGFPAPLRRGRVGLGRGLFRRRLFLLRRGFLLLPALRRLVAGRLGRRGLALDELHQRHRRRVARTRAHLQDSSVAARAALEARADVLEQLHDQRVVAERDARAAAACERVRLAERDERLDDAAQLLRLRQRSADRLRADQRRTHVAHQRPAMAAVAR